MIATVTLNPAVDKTIHVPMLDIGHVLRVRESHLDPGGKGINASRMVDRMDWPTIAFGFLAGEIGALVARALESEGVQSHFLSVPGQTRLNVTVIDDRTGQATGFYDRGPTVGTEPLRRLEHDIRPWLRAGPILVLAGSLPPGVPDDVYAHYVKLAHGASVKTILDTSGAPLELGIQARPYLIKPNLAEAEQLVGHPLPDVPSVARAARQIREVGVDVVVISLGARGAVCAANNDVWLAVPPRVEPRSTVGSGDSMVAGLAIALARGESIEAGLRLGTAAGAATALTPGTTLGSAADVRRLLPQVRIERLTEAPMAAAVAAAGDPPSGSARYGRHRSLRGWLHRVGEKVTPR